MAQPTDERLLREAKRREATLIRQMVGTVTDDSPFVVTVRGKARSGLVYLGGYQPSIGDRVLLVQKGNEAPIVLGSISGEGAPVPSWQNVGVVEMFGHSGVYGGASNVNRGTDSRLAALLGADAFNRSIGGSRLSWHEPAGGEHGGWAHVYRHTTLPSAETYDRTRYMSNRDVVVLWFGENDLPTLGPTTNLEPFTNALAACISRVRASAVYEQSHASVTYPTGSWSDGSAGAVAGAGNLLFASGGAYKYASSGTIQVVTPSSFPGGTVALAFLAGANGEGASVTFTVNGNASGVTLDTRSKNACDYGTSHTSGTNRNVTPAVARFTGLAAGTNTIVATVGSVATSCLFDAWWVEADPPPVVVCPGGWNTSSAADNFAFHTAGGFPYTPDEAGNDVEDLNLRMAIVCASFDDDVIYVDVEALFQRNPLCFSGDNTHPSDYGHSLVASAIASAVSNRARTRLAHAEGSGAPGFVSRAPGESDRNVIQAQQDDTVPLTLRGRVAGDQLYALLRLDGAGSYPSIELGRDLPSATDGRLGVADAAAQFVGDSAANDLVVRSDTGKIRLAATTTTGLIIDGANPTTPTGWAPTADQHLATKKYVDKNLGTWFAVPNIGNYAAQAPTANRVYYAQVVVPVPATLTGISFLMVTIGTGVNVRSALYDASGTRVANRTTNLACAALTTHQVAFDSTYAAAPGVYFVALVFGAAQGTFAGSNALSPCYYVAGPGSGATATSITPPTTAGQTPPAMTTY